LALILTKSPILTGGGFASWAFKIEEKIFKKFQKIAEKCGEILGKWACS
jgi:hypothetical protein